MDFGYVDGQPVDVPCQFYLNQFCDYMFEHVGLAPGTCCQQLFEEYSRDRNSHCGKDAWRHMDHQPHLIQISPISISKASGIGQTAYMPMGLTASTAGPFLGPGPALVPLQRQYAVGPNAVLNVPAQEINSLSPHAADFLRGHVESDLAVGDLQAIAGLNVYRTTRQHTGPHTRTRDRAATSEIYIPVTFEGGSSSDDVRNGHTSSGNTSRGVNFFNGRLPTIAANEGPPNDWSITFGLEDDGLLDPAVYARQAPVTRRHIRHNVIRPEMVELLDGTTALITPPDGRFGAVGSEILVTA